MNALTALSAAHARLIDAEREHRAEADAIERGREVLAAAKGKSDKSVNDNAAAVQRQAKRLEAQVREGRGGSLPTLTLSDKHLAEEISNMRSYEAAEQMVTTLETTERKSAEAVREAEAGVRKAALAVLGVEAEAKARKLEANRAVVEAGELELRGLLDLPGFVPSPAVLVALNDPIHTPLNLLRNTPDLDRPVAELAGHTNRSTAATAAWQARLTELVTRAPEPDEPSAERAA